MQSLLILPALLFAMTSLAAAINCSDIDDPKARLECFDHAHPRGDATDTGPMAEKHAGPILAEQAPTHTEPEVAQPQESRRQRRMFDKRDEIVVTARIVDVLNRDKQRMVFQLDNDQIWMQYSPRNLHIQKGDRVTIKAGLVGGYILRTAKGVSTRVKRL